MGIDHNFIGGYLTDQTSYENPELRWLKLAFYHALGRAFSDDFVAFLDESERRRKAEVFFYFPGSDDEVSETPYGGPPIRLDLDEFILVTEREDDVRLKALRETVLALRDGPKARYNEFALYWYPT